MISSILVALLAFSAAAESALSPVKSLLKRVSPVNCPEGPLKENEYLYQRIRKVRALMLCDVILQFSFLNAIGILISQAFLEFSDAAADRQWNWMDSMYWAVQSTFAPAALVRVLLFQFCSPTNHYALASGNLPQLRQPSDMETIPCQNICGQCNYFT